MAAVAATQMLAKLMAEAAAVTVLNIGVTRLEALSRDPCEQLI